MLLEGFYVGGVIKFSTQPFPSLEASCFSTLAREQWCFLAPCRLFG